MLLRNVTPDGKILGLTNYKGKNIIIVDQSEKELDKEKEIIKIFENQTQKEAEILKTIFKKCDELNIDPSEFICMMIESIVNEGQKNE